MRNRDEDYNFSKRDAALVGLKVMRPNSGRASNAEQREYLRILGQFRDLKTFDEWAMTQLLPECRPFSYPAGWTIIGRSQRVDHVLCLTSGSASVINGPAAGETYVAGDIVGDGTTVIAHGAVVSQGRVEGLAISRTDYARLQSAMSAVATVPAGEFVVPQPRHETSQVQPALAD
jgi:hypothetical protein